MFKQKFQLFFKDSFNPQGFFLGGKIFDKDGDFNSNNLKITEEGSKVNETILNALNNGQNIRIWLKDAPDLAGEYLENVKGLLLLKRLCFAYDDEVPRLSRKIQDAKTGEEELRCYYWVAEGLKSILTTL